MLKTCSLIFKPSRIRVRLFSSKRREEAKRSSDTPKKKRKVAIILSGCGMLDGTEIHEASAVAVHVTNFEMEAVFYAPKAPQEDVIDHIRNTPMKQERCALTEAARIARGQVTALCFLRECDADALVFPGGFGVAKTLSTYATDGANFNLDVDVLRIMQEFHEAKKPMAFMCISAILAARVFPFVRITLGKKGDIKKWPHYQAIEDASSLGAELEMRSVDSFTFDKQNLIFSTPAFMYAGTFAQIFEGIGHMIREMCKIMN